MQPVSSIRLKPDNRFRANFIAASGHTPNSYIVHHPREVLIAAAREAPFRGVRAFSKG
jgi:hypothetical protein